MQLSIFKTNESLFAGTESVQEAADRRPHHPSPPGCPLRHNAGTKSLQDHRALLESPGNRVD